MNVFKKGALSIALLALLFPITGFAQQQFNGTINNEKNEPISGAWIKYENGNPITASANDGSFHFITKENTIKIIVHHLAFRDTIISLNAGNKTQIKLEKKPLLSDEINIIATRVDDRTGAAYQNVTKEELEKQNLGEDLPYLLNYTPSVVTTSDAGGGVGYTGIRIRGNDATRVNVTINGIPVNDAESHQVYWVDLPDLASSVDNIQIQRGLGSSTNGAGAFGGSLNLQTTKVESAPFAIISSSGGSFKTLKNTVNFGSGLINNTFAVEGRFSKISSDGYIDRATSDLKSFYISGGYYGAKSSLRAVILSGKEKTYQAWYGVPQDSLATNRTYNPAGEYYDAAGNLRYYDNQTDNYQQDYYQLLYSHELSTNWNANLALHYTRGKGYYEEFKPGASLADYGLANIIVNQDTLESTNLARQLWLSNDFYGTTWSLDHIGSKFDFKTGGAYNEYKGDHYNEIISGTFLPYESFPLRYYFDKATKKDFNVFVKGTYRIYDNLTVWTDVQRRDVSYSFNGPDNTYLNTVQNIHLTFYNPKGGINYAFNHQQLYATIGAGHKEPVRDDYLNSIPANRPDAESMIDYEGGYRYQNNKIKCSINLYYMNYSNQLILTGRINDVGEYIRENVRNSYRSGIEAEVNYAVCAYFKFATNLTVSKNKIKQYIAYVDDYDGGPQVKEVYDNTDIAFSPSMINSTILTFLPVKNLNIDVCNKNISKQYLDNTKNETRKISAYSILDLRFSYTINVKKTKGIDFKFMLNNVLGNKYVSNGYTYSGYSSGVKYDYNYYYPQAGLNWLAGITARF